MTARLVSVEGFLLGFLMTASLSSHGKQKERKGGGGRDSMTLLKTTSHIMGVYDLI
jgi:hypothetical protein